MEISITNETQSLLKTVASQLSTVMGGKGKADIILSADNFKEYVVFPVIPAELPEIETPQNNDTFKGVVADLSVIGTMALRKVSWEGFLPCDVDKYPFSRPLGNNGDTIINFIRKYQDEYIPMRIAIVYNDGSVYLNMACLCDNFTYKKMNNGDYQYSINLVEYRMVTKGGLIR